MRRRKGSAGLENRPFNASVCLRHILCGEVQSAADRYGHLFQNGYKSILCEEDGFEDRTGSRSDGPYCHKGSFDLRKRGGPSTEPRPISYQGRGAEGGEWSGADGGRRRDPCPASSWGEPTLKPASNANDRNGKHGEFDRQNRGRQDPAFVLTSRAVRRMNKAENL